MPSLAVDWAHSIADTSYWRVAAPAGFSAGLGPFLGVRLLLRPWLDLMPFYWIRGGHLRPPIVFGALPMRLGEVSEWRGFL